MRIIDYSATEQIANCSLQRCSKVYDVQIRDIEYSKQYDRMTEESYIDLTEFNAFEFDYETETFVPLTLTESEIYDFKRGLLEYIDFESESDMFERGDREGSCW